MAVSSLYVAIGGNLVPDGFDSIQQGLEAACDLLPENGIQVKASSSWYQTAAVPVSEQPDFLNAVLHCSTELDAYAALSVLQKIEQDFGRVRTVKNAARVLDLDIIDFAGLVFDDEQLEVPHPRLHDRAFVLYPLRDVATDWVHPVQKKHIDLLIANLPAGQEITRLG